MQNCKIEKAVGHEAPSVLPGVTAASLTCVVQSWLGRVTHRKPGGPSHLSEVAVWMPACSMRQCNWDKPIHELSQNQARESDGGQGHAPVADG